MRCRNSLPRPKFQPHERETAARPKFQPREPQTATRARNSHASHKQQRERGNNLDLESAEALEDALSGFEGTVLAVTHDRWFARSFDRFLIFGSNGEVYESDVPVWDERRVTRAR